jgi:hypothetical protein
MSLEDHRRRMAELYAADKARRAEAEPEIARKEAALAREQARLARLQVEAQALEGELEQARSDIGEDDPPPP